MSVKAVLVPAEEYVQLTMPRDVAVTLRSIISRVGGDPHSFRGQMDDICDALSALGIKYDNARLAANGGITLR